jgi:hypothetical protein
MCSFVRKFVMLSALLVVFASSASAQKQYGPGVSDTEIKIGNIMPYSGPASAYGIIGKTMRDEDGQWRGTQGGIQSHAGRVYALRKGPRHRRFVLLGGTGAGPIERNVLARPVLRGPLETEHNGHSSWLAGHARPRADSPGRCLRSS